MALDGWSGSGNILRPKILCSVSKQIGQTHLMPHLHEESDMPEMNPRYGTGGASCISRA